MGFNVNKGKEERDNFEKFVQSMLSMELMIAQSYHTNQLIFCMKEGWGQRAADDLEWKLEVIYGELARRGLA